MKNQLIFIWVLLIIGGFSLGSVMFSKIIPMKIKKKDICESSDDHNPGASNVFKSCGVPMGMLCLLLDMLKGFLPVYIGYRIIGTETMLFAWIMSAPVLGHAIAPFNNFQGGKCIATSFGVMLAILPATWIVLLLAGLYIFFSLVVKIRPNRRRSIVTFGLFGIISFAIMTYEKRMSIAMGCIVISVTTIVKHLKCFSVSDEVLSTEMLSEERESVEIK